MPKWVLLPHKDRHPPLRAPASNPGVTPITTRGHAYPWRPSVAFGGKVGRVALDQIRAVDQERLGRRLGALDGATAQRVLDTLAEMFAP